MRFSSHKTELLQAVQTVSRILPSQTSEPHLLNVLLVAEAGEGDAGQLSLFATSRQVSIRRRIASQILEAGRCAVPGSLLADILQQFQTVESDSVDFTLDAEEGRRITLSSEGAVYHLASVDASLSPEMPEPTGDRAFSVGSEALRDVIRRVVIVNTGGMGASYDDILLEVRDGRLTLVSTDSVRLAAAHAQVAAETPDLDVKLPLISMAELGRILPQEGDVRVVLGNHQVSFEFTDTLYVAGTSEKSFPNYRAILPKTHPRYVTIDTRGFADALKGVTPVSRVNKNRVRMLTEAGLVKISSSSQEVGGDAERVVNAEVEGEPVELSFNSKYILDFLGVSDAEKIRMGLTSPTLPATFRPAGETADYVYLLMPINL